MAMNRRDVCRTAVCSLVAMRLSAPASAAASTASELRRVPSTGEMLPSVGLGSWITFNVGDDPNLRNECAAVIAAFLQEGGGVIDSSPMYGSAQSVIGYGLAQAGNTQALFSADKVWTDGSNGASQVGETQAAWGLERFDLLQVHNLVDWQAHLPMLFDMKSRGMVRYVGVTTSHGRRHDDLERIMRTQPIDFVQLTYNAADQEAEKRLMQLAHDRGIGVIANRPFQRGRLPERLRGRPLPDWAAEVGATSWAQLLLGFVLSHPDITVAIPATSRVDHLRENKAVARGQTWNPDLRVRMAAIASDL